MEKQRTVGSLIFDTQKEIRENGKIQGSEMPGLWAALHNGSRGAFLQRVRRDEEAPTAAED